MSLSQRVGRVTHMELAPAPSLFGTGIDTGPSADSPSGPAPRSADKRPRCWVCLWELCVCWGG